MANPNSEIWGAPSSWIYSLRQSGLETTSAKLGHFDKPKTAYFGTGSTSGFEGSLVRAINVSHKLTANEFLDESICPCGQDPQVSPWGKIAIFNKNHDGSTVPEVQDFTDKNINWFFADKPTSFPLAERQLIKTGTNFIYNEQYAPKATIPINANNNIPVNLCPYVSWGVKSLLLSIEIGITANDTNPISGSLLWVTLDEWKNNYSSTHYMTGLRFFVRGCTALNSTTLALTYNNDGALPSGNGCSGLICPMNKITVKNGGETIPTQFLYFMGFAGTTRRAHIFTPTGQIGNDSSTLNAPWLGVLPCWNYFQDQTIQVYHPYTTDYYYYYKIPYSDDTYNKIMSIAALFGCFFTPTNKYVFDYDMLDNDLYLPIIDENGVAHGQYTKGAANATNPLYSKNSIRDIDYDPTQPPTPTDPNTYSNSSYFKFVALGSVGNKRYSLGVTDVNGLISDLWSLLTTFSQDSFDNFTQKVQAGFLVTNPIDSIVSLLCFPFTIPHNNDNVPIKLGKYDMTARGNTVSQSTYTINFTGIPIFPRFGNCYLDYEPYTNYEVYIPFCGTVPLKAADIIGHTLNVKLIVDLYTGSCTGYILADDLVIETITGTVAITIPITGMDSSTINSQIVNANLNYKSSQYSAGAAIGSMVSVSGFIGALSNPAEAVNKIAQSQITEERAQYELTHIPTQPHIIGASSPALGWCCDTIARVMIYYPTGDVITDSKPPSLIEEKINSFGNLNGFSCLKWGKVREFSGFTLGNIKLDGVPCTESERARLKQLFSTGVYL